MFPIFDFLQTVGISRKEIDVYVYLMSVESALPMEIAKSTKMKRSTVYVILDLLKEKGLVREIQTGKRFAYSAEDPERIKFLLEEHKLALEKSIQSVTALLPEIRAVIRKRGEPPIIKYFEGESAVQNSMEELAGNPRFRTDMDYGIFPLELVYDLFRSRSLRKYIDLRITDNKLFKILYTAKEGRIDVKEGQEAVLVDENDFPLSCDISIFEDEVRMHMLGKSIQGFMIKNKEFADTLISLVKLALKGAKCKEKNI